MRILHMIAQGRVSAADGVKLLDALGADGPAWLLRLVGPFIPQLRDHGLDELILALAETTSSQAPLYVDVDEGELGERVQVYIG